MPLERKKPPNSRRAITNGAFIVNPRIEVRFSIRGPAAWVVRSCNEVWLGGSTTTNNAYSLTLTGFDGTGRADLSKGSVTWTVVPVLLERTSRGPPSLRTRSHITALPTPA